MRFPKTVKIGGHLCKIRYPYTFKERSDIIGQAIYHSPREIRLASRDSVGTRIDDSDVLATFMHELLHQICDIFNGGVQIDERDLEALAQGLFAVIRDNGWLDAAKEKLCRS
jgi:hypothetical protein